MPVHYFVLSDEGHGFSKNESALAAYQITDRDVWGDVRVELKP